MTSREELKFIGSMWQLRLFQIEHLSRKELHG